MNSLPPADSVAETIAKNASFEVTWKRVLRVSKYYSTVRNVYLLKISFYQHMFVFIDFSSQAEARASHRSAGVGSLESMLLHVVQ